MTKCFKCSDLVLTCLLAATVGAQQENNTPGSPPTVVTTSAFAPPQPTPETACNPAEYRFLKSRAQAWADLAHDRDENASLATPGTPKERVVFLEAGPVEGRDASKCRRLRGNGALAEEAIRKALAR